MTVAKVRVELLIVVLIASAFVLVTSAPAHACSCIARTEPQQVDSAEVVFRGVVTTKVLPSSEPQSSLDPVEYTFDVEQVFKGAASTPQRVTSARSSASCGVEMQEGVRYLVFADSEPDGDLTVSLCGGTRTAAPGETPGSDPPPSPGPAPPADPMPGAPRFTG